MIKLSNSQMAHIANAIYKNRVAAYYADKCCNRTVVFFLDCYDSYINLLCREAVERRAEENNKEITSEIIKEIEQDFEDRGIHHGYLEFVDEIEYNCESQDSTLSFCNIEYFKQVDGFSNDGCYKRGNTCEGVIYYPYNNGFIKVEYAC